MPLTRGLAVFLAALALVLGASRAALAVCNHTTCSAAAILTDSACCGAVTCLLDGTITLSGPACNLDFGARNVTLSGSLVVGLGTLTLHAGGLTVTGLLNARGTTAKPGGNVTLALGAGGLSLARGSGTAIDLEGFAAGGGTLTAVVGGRVSLSGGDIDASALETEAGGGTITLQQTAGSTPMSVGISIRANAGTDGIGGTITLQAPADLNVTDTGAIVALGGFVDGGSIELDAEGGKVTVAGAAVIRAKGLGDSGGDGGDISITAGSVEVDGTLDAGGGSDPSRDTGGQGGTIEIEARTGALTLMQGGQGLMTDGAAGNDGGEVDLTTDSPAHGALTVAGSVSAHGSGGLSGRPAGGGTIDIESAHALTLTQSLDVTGVGGGSGVATLAAQRDVMINDTIDGRDAVGLGEVDVSAGHDLTFTGNNLRVNATLDGEGGSITALASNNLTLTGSLLDASGAGTGAGSLISLGAGHNLSVDRTSTLNAKSEQGSGVPGGNIRLTAGSADLAGNLQVDGTVTATGHASTGAPPNPASIVLSGCRVTISSTGQIDSSGDSNARNLVIGRTGITISGKLHTTSAATGGSNTANSPVGTTPTVSGSNAVVPPFGPCAGGCAKPPCTARDTPAGCLVPCPACGNGAVEFPEQCDPPGCPTCDLHCQTLQPAGCVDANACTADSCDPVFGCINEPVADRMGCDDANPCTTGDACADGVCVGGPPPDCDDGNVCTDDACDASTGCTHTPVVCPNDHNACNGAETCTPGVGCHHGTLVTCPAGQVCNPATGNCVPKPCSADADCNDGNPCTADTCAGGFCTITSDPNGVCTDSDACNGTETCHDGVCMPGTPPDCDDGNPCTNDGCDSVRGCVNAAIAGCCRTPADCPGSNAAPPASTTSAASSTAAAPSKRTARASCRAKPARASSPPTGASMRTPPTARRAATTVARPTPARVGAVRPGPRSPAPPTPTSARRTSATRPPGCVHQPIAGCCHNDTECNDHDNCTRDACDPNTHLCSNALIDPFAECKSCSVDTDCDVIGRCAGQACGPAGVCIAVTALNCDDRLPDFNGVCHLDGTGQPQCSYRCVTPQACDDGDLCTDDSYDTTTGCKNTPKTSFAAVTCRLDTVDAAIHGASATDLAPSVAAKLGKLIGKARTKLAAGETAGHGKPALKALKVAAKQLKMIPRIVRAAQKRHKIAAALATAVLDAASGGSQALSTLMASITP